jgi:ribosomal protein S18 acetylase RimI-like enzyme
VSLTVTFTDEANAVLALAGPFLVSQPVRHNLVLSLLHDRVSHAEAGCYWTVWEGDDAVGVVFQSPTHYPAVVTPMRPEAVAAAVGAVVEGGAQLPGVLGEVATAARFAGEWTERYKSAARPEMGQRLYELVRPTSPGQGAGRLRGATASDRSLIVEWMNAFDRETGDLLHNTEEVVDRQLAAAHLWLWEDGRPVSLAAHTKPVANVVRIQAVYTRADARRRGHAAACVSALCARLTEAGHRCVLYADLANPVSNSVYRRIGFRAVDEVLRYRFT